MLKLQKIAYSRSVYVFKDFVHTEINKTTQQTFMALFWTELFWS